MSITAAEFASGHNAFRDELIRRAQRSGPSYSPTGHSIVWHDQYFDFEIEPAGTTNCVQALRVGSTLSHLDVVLVASHKNAGDLTFPAGATITLGLMQGDSEEGVFEDIGPTVCIKAPPEGMSIAPDDRVCRFPIGDFSKPWLKVSLEFSGAITGGTVDCALGYIPH